MPGTFIEGNELYDVAITFDQAGTTRDVVSARTAVGGWPVLLSDTAGLRASPDKLESAGVPAPGGI